jgi:hypothetical protein
MARRAASGAPGSLTRWCERIASESELERREKRDFLSFRADGDEQARMPLGNLGGALELGAGPAVLAARVVNLGEILQNRHERRVPRTELLLRNGERAGVVLLGAGKIPTPGRDRAERVQRAHEHGVLAALVFLLDREHPREALLRPASIA